MSRFRKLAFGLLLALVALLLADQAVQRFALADSEFRGRAVAPFDPPLFNASQRASLARIRELAASGRESLAGVRFDPELGWSVPPGFQGRIMRYDWAGCRIATGETLRTKSPKRRRVVLIGGSFTAGDEVEGEATWAARVGAARPDLELCNLAVGAYGIDQALLRYERDGAPLDPDEVWLGFMPAASLRCLGVYHAALRHDGVSIAFKPRFVLRPDGELERVACPAPSLERMIALLDDQRAFLDALGDDEFWVERARPAYQPRGSHWSHRFASTRLYWTRIEGGRRSAAEWMGDPGSEPARLLHALLAEADRIVDGPRLRVVVLPSREDLAGPRWWHAMLAEKFEPGDVLDLTEVLPADFGASDACWAPGGHYSEEGNRVVAERILARIDE